MQPHRMLVGAHTLVLVAFALTLGACGQPAANNASGPAAPTASSAPVPTNAVAIETEQPTEQLTEQPAEQAPASSIDPCVLLTKADAEAALGEVVEDEAVRLDTASLQGCQYSAKNTPLRSVSVNVLTNAILKEAESPYSNVATFYTSMKRGATSEPVAGLGDAADWVKIEAVVVPQLWVVQGDVLFSVRVGAPTEDSTRAQTENLARLVLTRLP